MKMLMSFIIALTMMVVSATFTATPSEAALSNHNTPLVAQVDLGSISATADVYGVYIPKKSRIVGFYVVDTAGLSASDSNYAIITLQSGSTVLATQSTKLTGGTGSLSALVPDAGVVATGSSGLVEAGSYLKIVYTETGTYAMTTAKAIVVYYPL